MSHHFYFHGHGHGPTHAHHPPGPTHTQRTFVVYDNGASPVPSASHLISELLRAGAGTVNVHLPASPVFFVPHVFGGGMGMEVPLGMFAFGGDGGIPAHVLDPNAHPAKPRVADLVAVNGLPRPAARHVTGQPCPICMDALATPDDCRLLPCRHAFHAACISEWLARSHTCPTCRWELETDDADFNVGVRKRMEARRLAEQCAVSDVGMCAAEAEGDAEVAKPELALQCGHRFHGDCLRTCLAAYHPDLAQRSGVVDVRCPRCRRDATVDVGAVFGRGSDHAEGGRIHVGTASVSPDMVCAPESSSSRPGDAATQPDVSATPLADIGRSVTVPAAEVPPLDMELD